MKIDKNFKTQWMNEISKMSQAIGNNDLYEATKHKEKADALFEEAKRINEYFENPSKTFGVMNNAIKKYVSSEYLKENKKPIADYISMMKSDKNLVSENKFFDAIDTYNKTIGDSKGFIDEVTKRIKKEINPKTINESNDKMVNFMKKYKITIDEDMINPERMAFYESCQNVINHDMDVLKIASLYENKSKIAKYIEQHSKDKKEDKDTEEKRNIVCGMIDKFNKKHSKMDKSEKQILQTLKSDKDEDKPKKKAIFQKLKENNQHLIHELLKGDDVSEENINLIKELEYKLNKMEFEENNITEQVAILLDMKELIEQPTK